MLTQRDEQRLRHVIKDAPTTSGRKYPHWFTGGFFITVQRRKVTLWFSEEYDANHAEKLFSVDRTAMGYVVIADRIEQGAASLEDINAQKNMAAVAAYSQQNA